MPDPGLTTTLTPDGLRVDRFSDANIRAAADAVLASLPKDKNGVLLNVNLLQVDGGKPTFNAAIAYRLEDSWTVAAAYQKDWTTKSQGVGISVGHSW